MPSDLETTMKTLIPALALLVLAGSPALAQSYDPDVGSGNIVPPVNARHAPHGFHNGFRAFARVKPSWAHHHHAHRAVHRS
jgi:hypothetical protein